MTEQIMTRTYKDGSIQLINKDVWDSWTFGNPEQKVANGLTTVEVPQDLLDKPIKFNIQTMQWEDASEDEINRVKSQIKQVSDELKKAQEERENAKTDSEEAQRKINSMQQTIDELQEMVSGMAQGGAE
ncbi:hypothetical protein R4Y45_06040 [Holzapfeliella sp. He02]|uniref:Uncharacterized protein n=1 Tax=Holzapfeliella saturejae TaxID=3082953 RepID=A0ABU8SHC9_9LACO